MNLQNRFGLGCSTLMLGAAAVLLYNILGSSGSFRSGEPLIIAGALALFGAMGVVGTIAKIRREEGDALGNDKWLVILGSFLFTSGACLFALGGLCSLMGVKDFNSMAAIGGGMLIAAAALAYWRRSRRKPERDDDR